MHQLPLLTSQLTVPSLWITGSRDGVMAPLYGRHLAGYSRLHRFELLEGGGHLALWQMADRLAPLIDSWLQEDVLVPLERRSASGGQAAVHSMASPFSCNSANCA